MDLRRKAIIPASGIGLLAERTTAASGNVSAGPMVVVADTRNLSGISAWWAALYNDSPFEFTILTLFVISLFGFLIGIFSDFDMDWGEFAPQKAERRRTRR